MNEPNPDGDPAFVEMLEGLKRDWGAVPTDPDEERAFLFVWFRAAYGQGYVKALEDRE